MYYTSRGDNAGAEWDGKGQTVAAASTMEASRPRRGGIEAAAPVTVATAAVTVAAAATRDGTAVLLSDPDSPAAAQHPVVADPPRGGRWQTQVAWVVATLPIGAPLLGSGRCGVAAGGGSESPHKVGAVVCIMAGVSYPSHLPSTSQIIPPPAPRPKPTPAVP